MSGDYVNSRGVKRKLSTEIDCDQVDQSALGENECRRQRVDLGLASCTFPPPSLPQVGEEEETPTNCLLVNGVKSTAYSPDSLSSQSMSDEDEDDDDDGSEDEEEEEEEEGEFGEDESLESDPLDESQGQASGESESGYDERASSNSSLSDSATSESDFAPIAVAPAESLSSAPTLPSASHLTAASPSHSAPSPCPSFASPSTITTTTSSCSNPIDDVNGSFCAYVAPADTSSGGSRSSSAYVPPRAHTNPRKDSQYNRQRQQIFNLSLCKLSRFRQSADPSLLRSVLICNTLRMLERELEKEGFKINFGPNGVSFISPVPNPPDLDFMPVFQPVPPPSTSFDCTPVPEPSPYVAPPAVESVEPYASYGAPCDANGDSCSDYDKYFSMDSSSPSGRATPFLKNYPPNEYSTSRSSDSSSSAFGYSDEQQQTTPDRLNSLNWSNMLTFSNSPSVPASSPSSVSSSSSPSSNEVISGSTLRPLDQTSSEILPSLLPYAEDQSPEVQAPMLSSASILTSSCTSLLPSSSSATFATLLPPTSTPSSSLPLMEPTPSVTQDSSYLMAPNTTGSTYYTSNSLSSQYSSSLQTQCGASSSSAAPAASSSNTPGLMSTSSYMNSYLGYSNPSTTDEIFGDIDLNLYDFDIFTSPLSPPSVSNKTGPIMSAEELIREVNGGTGSSSSSVGGCSTTSSLLSISHYSVNAFSGQSFTSSSYCASSSSSMTNVVASITTSSSANSQLMMSQAVSNMTSSPPPANCGSSSATGASMHLHSASGRYYKTSEERDQQTVATIKCHN